ncbi:MAG: ABC transporter substrate-binding protein [Deltaproteobacteria bacterium]|nr:ABC transporter substrate-binding protein [Deltaproteobacteria bacterium]
MRCDRRTSPFILRLIVLTTLFFSRTVLAQTAPEKMIVGYSAQAGAYAPIWITKEAGLFKKNGLDVNLVFIPGGPTAAAAMIANEVQAMAMAGPAIVASNLAGSDLIMTAGIVNTFAFQLVTVKSITSPKQLKGKRIGVNRFGAAPDVAARYALNHLKIDPREVTILQLGEQSTRLEAMKAGQLDAAILLPPMTTIAQKDGMNILLDMSELGGEFLITGLASSQKFLTQYKALATRLMRAFVEGIHYFKTNRRESEKIIARYMRTDNLQAVGATWDYFAAKIVPRKPYPSVKGVKALLDLAAKERPEAAKVQPERFINATLLKELDDSGFIDGLYR